MITQDRLEQIRDADAMAGEDLRFCPPAWQDRRDLLAYIQQGAEADAAHALVVIELSRMLEPISGGATTLPEIVARMKMAAEIRASIVEAMQPIQEN